MPLFPSAKRTALPAVSSVAPCEMQQNVVGQYIAALNAHKDTRDIVAQIHRANDMKRVKGAASVRLQQFMLDHVTERVLPEERKRVIGQIQQDFPTDPRVRRDVHVYERDLFETRQERDQLKQQLFRAERHLKAERDKRKEAQASLSVTSRESQAVIERLDEDLARAHARCEEFDRTIGQVLMACAQRPETTAGLVPPRSRPHSMHVGGRFGGFSRGPSPSPEPASTSASLSEDQHLSHPTTPQAAHAP